MDIFTKFFNNPKISSSKARKINVFRLFFGMLPNDLPKELFFPKLGEEINDESTSLEKKLYKLFELSKKDFNKINKKTDNGIINNYINEGNTPNYIFKKGSESILYNDFKRSKKLEFRPMGVESPSMYLIFMYNTFTVFKPLLFELYNTKEKYIKKLIETSNSPILENGKVIAKDSYDIPNKLSDNSKDLKNSYKYRNKISTNRNNFITNLIRDSYKESKYPYYMTLDIQSFFPSIYTHNFSRLVSSDLYKKLIKTNKVSKASKNKIDSYFRFLDIYNMQCNEDETRGIISGPLSSRISSELLSLSIYYEATHNMAVFKNLVYTRYVDDVVAFSNESTTLHELYYGLGEILQNYGLEYQNDKVLLDKGLYIPKSARLWIANNNVPFLRNSGFNIDGINSFLDFKLYVKQLINDDKFSTLRAIFTELNNKRITFGQYNSIYNKYIFESIFYNFLLKVVIICPYLSVSIYKLMVNQVKLNKEHSHNILHKYELTSNNFLYDFIIYKVIKNSLKDVNKRFKNSVIQIWTYYLINVVLNKLTDYKKEIRKTNSIDDIYSIKENLFKDYYKESNRGKTIKLNPLILMSFISDNNKINCLIYGTIKSQYNQDINNYKRDNKVLIRESKNKSNPSPCDTIMNSKWAFPIYKLHSIYHFYKRGDNFIQKIFKKNKMPYIIGRIISGLYKHNGII